MCNILQIIWYIIFIFTIMHQNVVNIKNYHFVIAFCVYHTLQTPISKFQKHQILNHKGVQVRG
jgi:hypothetical protein